MRIGRPTEDQRANAINNLVYSQPDLTTKDGALNYIANASRYDRVLFSRDFKNTVDGLYKDGLVDQGTRQQLAKFKAERALVLANDEEKRQYFTPENEYRPDLSAESIQGKRQAYKQYLGEQIPQIQADEEKYLGKLGYDRSDVQRFGPASRGRAPEGAAFIGGTDFDVASGNYTLRDLGIGFKQAPQIAAGMAQGFYKPVEAAIDKLTNAGGIGAEAAYQQGEEPLQDAGAAFGSGFQERLSTMPGTIIGGSGGSRLGGALGALAPKKYRGVGILAGRLLGAAGGGTLGTSINETINNNAFGTLLGSAADAARTEFRQTNAYEYPLASRLGSLAGDLAFFKPTLKIPGVGVKAAVDQLSKKGTRALKNTGVNKTVSDLGDRSIEAAQGMYESYMQSERNKAAGGDGYSPWQIIGDGLTGALLGGETPLGKEAFRLADKAMDPRFLASKLAERRDNILESRAAKAPMAESIPSETGDGFIRLNLGGKLTGDTDEYGRPILRGAEYALYNPKARKANIYVDNEFPLEGRRSASAAERLQTVMYLFKRQPVISYTDSRSGITRNVIGISRDAGIVVRDVNRDGRSRVQVVPLTSIGNAQIRKRVGEVLTAQGVTPNAKPANFDPNVFDNADTRIFKDKILLSNDLPLFPGRVVKQVGNDRQGMYVVSLPDGTHIRLNESQINPEDAGKPYVRGMVRDEDLPSSLAELSPKQRIGPNQWRFADASGAGNAEVVELTDDQMRLLRRGRSARSAEWDAYKSEEDPAKRNALLEIYRANVAKDIEGDLKFEPADDRFSRADVIDVQTKEFGRAVGIVVGKGDRGYVVRLVDHPTKSAFVVQNSQIVGDHLGNDITPGVAESAIGEDVDGDGTIGTVDGEDAGDIAAAAGITADRVDIIELSSTTRTRLGTSLASALDTIDFSSLLDGFDLSTPEGEVDTEIEGEPLAPEAGTEAEAEDLPEVMFSARDTLAGTEAPTSQSFVARTRYSNVDGTIYRTEDGHLGLRVKLTELDGKGAPKRAFETEYVIIPQPDGSFDVHNAVDGFDPARTPEAVYTPAAGTDRRVAVNTAIQRTVQYATGQNIRDANWLATANIEAPSAADLEKKRKADEREAKAAERLAAREEERVKREAERERDRAEAARRFDANLELRRRTQQQNAELRAAEVEVERLKADNTTRLNEARQRLADLQEQANKDKQEARTAQQALQREMNQLRADMNRATTEAQRAATEQQRQAAETLQRELERQAREYETQMQNLRTIITNGTPQNASNTAAVEEAIRLLTQNMTTLTERLNEIGSGRAISAEQQRVIDEQLAAIEAERQRREQEYADTVAAIQAELDALKEQLEEARKAAVNAAYNRDGGATGRPRTRRTASESRPVRVEYGDINNSRQIETITTELYGNRVEVDATTVRNRNQFETVMIEQYNFSPEGASAFGGIVDHFARAWAMRQLNIRKSRITGSASDLETVRREDETAAVYDEEGNPIEDGVVRSILSTDNDAAKSVAFYMRKFYSERLASFALLRNAPALDAMANALVFKRAAAEGMSSSVIVGLSARSVEDGMHEVFHALLRGMTPDERKKFYLGLRSNIKNMNIDFDNVPASVEEEVVGMLIASIRNNSMPRIFRGYNRETNKAQFRKPNKDIATFWRDSSSYLNATVQNVTRRFIDNKQLVEWQAPYDGQSKLYKGTQLVIKGADGKDALVTVNVTSTTDMESYERNKDKYGALPPNVVVVKDASGDVSQITKDKIVKYGGYTNGLNPEMLSVLSDYLGAYYTRTDEAMREAAPEAFDGFSDETQRDLDDSGGDDDDAGDELDDDFKYTNIDAYKANTPANRVAGQPIYIIYPGMSQKSIEANIDLAKTLGVPNRNIIVSDNVRRFDYRDAGRGERVISSGMSRGRDSQEVLGFDIYSYIQASPAYDGASNDVKYAQILKSPEIINAIKRYMNNDLGYTAEQVEAELARPRTGTDLSYDNISEKNNIKRIAFLMSRFKQADGTYDVSRVSTQSGGTTASGIDQLYAYATHVWNNLDGDYVVKQLANNSEVAKFLKPDYLGDAKTFGEVFGKVLEHVATGKPVALYSPSLPVADRLLPMQTMRAFFDPSSYVTHFLNSLGSDRKARVEQFPEEIRKAIDSVRNVIGGVVGDRSGIWHRDLNEMHPADVLDRAVKKIIANRIKEIDAPHRFKDEVEITNIETYLRGRLSVSLVEASRAVSEIWQLSADTGRGEYRRFLLPEMRVEDPQTVTFVKSKGTSDNPKGTVKVNMLTGKAVINVDGEWRDAPVVANMNTPWSRTFNRQDLLNLNDILVPSRHWWTVAIINGISGTNERMASLDVPKSIMFSSRKPLVNVETLDVVTDTTLGTDEVKSQVRKGYAELDKSGRIQTDADGKVVGAYDARGNASHTYHVYTNVLRMSPARAIAHYARTESPEFKRWSNGAPLIESVVSDDSRINVPLKDLSPTQTKAIRKHMSGQEILRKLDEMEGATVTDDDVAELMVAMDDYYRGERSPTHIKRVAEHVASDNTANRVYYAGVSNELNSVAGTQAKSFMRDKMMYDRASVRPRTGKPIVSIGYVPGDGTAKWLPSAHAYVMPSGVSKTSGFNNKPYYVRMDNPVVIDMGGRGIAAADVEALYKKHPTRDGIVLLNVKHSVGGNHELQNISIPRNSIAPLSLDKWNTADTKKKADRTGPVLSVMLSSRDELDIAHEVVRPPVKIAYDWGDVEPTASVTGKSERTAPNKPVNVADMGGYIIDQMNDITRLTLSADFAFTTLQAGIILLTNPAVGFKALLAGMRGMMPNLQIELPNGQKVGYRKLGREQFHQYGNKLREMDVYEEAREAELPLSMFEIDKRFDEVRERELYNLRLWNPEATVDDVRTTLMDIDELGTNDEWYMKNRLSSHIPGQGMFERYNILVHDTILLLQFDQMKKSLMAHGYEPGTEKYKVALRDSARILAVSVGDIKYSTNSVYDARASRVAKVLFTAPRWLLSRMFIDPAMNAVLSSSHMGFMRDIMGQDNPVFDLYKGDRAAAAIGKQMWGRLVGVWAFLMILSQMIRNFLPDDMDVETNIDRNIGRVRVGDFRMDAPAGVFDHYRLGYRLLSAAMLATPAEQKKSRETGSNVMYDTFADIHRELQYKASPLYNWAGSWFVSGRTPIGEPTFGKNEASAYFYENVIKPRLIEHNGGYAPWMDDVRFSNAITERFPTGISQMMETFQAADEWEKNAGLYASVSTVLNNVGLKVELKPQQAIKAKKRATNYYSDEDTPSVIKLLGQGRGSEIFRGTE